jgi:hypothetical protein
MASVNPICGRGVAKRRYLDRCFRLVIVIVEKAPGVVYLATTLDARSDRDGARPREWGRTRPWGEGKQHHDVNLTSRD